MNILRYARLVKVRKNRDNLEDVGIELGNSSGLSAKHDGQESGGVRELHPDKLYQENSERVTC